MLGLLACVFVLFCCNLFCVALCACVVFVPGCLFACSFCVFWFAMCWLVWLSGLRDCVFVCVFVCVVLYCVVLQ